MNSGVGWQPANIDANEKFLQSAKVDNLRQEVL